MANEGSKPAGVAAPQGTTVQLPQVNAEQAMLAALSDARVPRIYANQFFNFIGSHDLTVMLGVNTVPTAVVNLSYPLAKALGQSLTNAVTEYERKTGQQVGDTVALDAALKG